MCLQTWTHLLHRLTVTFWRLLGFFSISQIWIKVPFVEIHMKTMKRRGGKNPRLCRNPGHNKKEEDRRSPLSNSEILVYWAAPSGRWRREFGWHIESLAPIWAEKGLEVEGETPRTEERFAQDEGEGESQRRSGLRGETCSGFTTAPRALVGHHHGCWWSHSNICIYPVRGFSRAWRLLEAKTQSPEGPLKPSENIPS